MLRLTHLYVLVFAVGCDGTKETKDMPNKNTAGEQRHLQTTSFAMVNEEEGKHLDRLTKQRRLQINTSSTVDGENRFDWPDPSNYDLLGKELCRGDDLFRPMSGMEITLKALLVEGNAVMAQECIDICDKFATTHNRCMGVTVSSLGDCLLLDRDWLKDETSMGDYVGHPISFSSIKHGFPGQHLTNAQNYQTDVSDSGLVEYRCWRRRLACSSAPICADLNRYPCNLGKIPNTCDQCLPRKRTVTNGVEPGNDMCMDAALSYARPKLKIAWGTPTLRVNNGRIYEGYNAGALGVAYTMKWAWKQKNRHDLADTSG
jgi:hypothetical protein